MRISGENTMSIYIKVRKIDTCTISLHTKVHINYDIRINKQRSKSIITLHTLKEMFHYFFTTDTISFINNWNDENFILGNICVRLKLIDNVINKDMTCQNINFSFPIALKVMETG